MLGELIVNKNMVWQKTWSKQEHRNKKKIVLSKYPKEKTKWQKLLTLPGNGPTVVTDRCHLSLDNFTKLKHHLNFFVS